VQFLNIFLKYYYFLYRLIAIRPYDPSLSQEGHQQAKELGGYYKSIHSTTPIHRILSSPLVRTLQTSTAIADELDAKIWFVFLYFFYLFIYLFLTSYFYSK
jgi:broad specificity phosphatase PhoE